MTNPTPADHQVRHQLIDAKAVGLRLGCSWRTVLRLADRGTIPWGVKVGTLRRWDTAEIDAYIASGCRPPKKSATAKK